MKTLLPFLLLAVAQLIFDGACGQAGQYAPKTASVSPDSAKE